MTLERSRIMTAWDGGKGEHEYRFTSHTLHPHLCIHTCSVTKGLSLSMLRLRYTALAASEAARSPLTPRLWSRRACVSKKCE